MTRLLREHPVIDPELDSNGRLVAIRWAGRREPVEVCNQWRVEANKIEPDRRAGALRRPRIPRGRDGVPTR